MVFIDRLLDTHATSVDSAAAPSYQASRGLQRVHQSCPGRHLPSRRSEARQQESFCTDVGEPLLASSTGCVPNAISSLMRASTLPRTKATCPGRLLVSQSNMRENQSSRVRTHHLKAAQGGCRFHGVAQLPLEEVLHLLGDLPLAALATCDRWIENLRRRLSGSF